MDNNEMVVENSARNDNVDKEAETVEFSPDYESDEWGDTSNCCDIFNPQVANDLKPSVGQQFQTIEDVYIFYNAYAKQGGFSIRNSVSKKIEGTDVVYRKEFVCFKQGKGTMVSDVASQRRRGTVKEGCKAKIAMVRSNDGSYVVTQFFEGHSHPLATPSKKHLLRSHRSVSSAQKSLTQQLGVVNIPSNPKKSTPHKSSTIVSICPCSPHWGWFTTVAIPASKS